MEDRIAGLFDRHRGRLHRMASRMSRDAEEARDLVQETFMRAVRRCESIPGDDAGAEAWLVRTMVNLCRDRHRRLRVRAPGAARPGAPEPRHDPEPALMIALQVRHAVSALPARRRAVVVLHELEEKTAAEVAAILGMSAITVRWHLSRARRELKEILGHARSQG